MPTIEIDDDLYGFLQRNAEVFVDNPNSTLKRLLNFKSNYPAVLNWPKLEIVDTHHIGSNEFCTVFGNSLRNN